MLSNNRNILPLKISSWIILLLCLPLFAPGQQKDTARLLSNDLDSVRVVEAPAAEEEYVDEEADEDGEKEEEPSAFLPTWLAQQDSIQVRHLDPAAKKAQQDDDAFWYANQSFKKEKKQQEEPGRRPLIMQPAFQAILWVVVIAGFIAFIIIFLSNSNVGIFRKSKYIGEIDNEETDMNDIFAINYQQELDKAVASGNHRLGVRLLFLRLLRNLADRNIIDYKQDRTNFDYLVQLQSTSYYADFFRLTRHYEYSWYGQFALEQDKFAIIRKEFENFDRKLN